MLYCVAVYALTIICGCSTDNNESLNDKSGSDRQKTQVKVIDSFDFSALDETRHMLAWIHPNATEAIRAEFESNLNTQVPGSKLLGLHVTSAPDWLTGTIPLADDDENTIVVRTGFSFEFVISVRNPEGQIQNLQGVYTWVSVNMNDPENIKQRTWVDLNGGLDQFGYKGLLKERVYLERLESE